MDLFVPLCNIVTLNNNNDYYYHYINSAVLIDLWRIGSRTWLFGAQTVTPKFGNRMLSYYMRLVTPHSTRASWLAWPRLIPGTTLGWCLVHEMTLSLSPRLKQTSRGKLGLHSGLRQRRDHPQAQQTEWMPLPELTRQQKALCATAWG